jgi:hypothetical protein
VAGVEEQLNEVRGPDYLRTRFLQALQRLDADCVRGVELGEIKLKGLECGAYPEQVRDLLIGETSGYSHDMPSSLIRDVNPAFHVGRLAALQPTRHPKSRTDRFVRRHVTRFGEGEPMRCDVRENEER